MRVVILGAGIAGLSCALALRHRASLRAGDVVLYERESADTLPEKRGHGLILMQNGVDALAALGCEGLLEGCRPLTRSIFQDPRGTVVRATEMERAYCVTRAALVEAMRAKLGACAITFEHACARVVLAARGPGESRAARALVFRGGSVRRLAEDELLVVACGVRSPLFAALNPGAVRAHSRVKEIVTSTHMPDLAKQLGGNFVKTSFPDRGLAFGLLAPTPDRVIGFLQFDAKRHPTPARDATPADFRAFLDALFTDAPEPMATYLRHVDLESAHVWHPFNADVPRNVHASNAVLIGDAAHPLLPFTSQGVSAALEDAIMLADALRGLHDDTASLAGVLAGFAADRRRDVEAYVEGGRRILESFIDPMREFALPYVESEASKLEEHLSLPAGSLRELFRLLDEDADGRLDRGEMGALLRLLGVDLDEREGAALFDEVDEGHDGSLGVDDVLRALGGDGPASPTLVAARAALSPRRIGQLTLRARVEQIFRQLDRDQSGGIDRGEFATASALLGVVDSPEALDASFSSLDANGDGTISLDDLVDGVQRGLRTRVGPLGALAAHLTRGTAPADPGADPLFADGAVDRTILRERAYNFRWATHPPDVIPLTAADPDFPVAREISDAMARYLASGYLSYGPAEGLPRFRSTVAEHMRAERGVPCEPDTVFVTNSAASGLYLVAERVLSPGDEALIADPVDFLFERSVVAAGAVPRRYRLHERRGWTVDLDEVEALVTPRTRLLSICNPHNPSGRVWTRAELEGLCRIALRRDLWILSDEVWGDIVYTPHRLTSAAALSPEIAKRTFTVYGFSKGYGLAGLRLGVVLCPDAAEAATIAALSHADETAYGVSTLSQIAGIAALEEAGEWQRRFLAHLQRQRDHAVARLREMPGVQCATPEGTYVVFPDVSSFDRDPVDIAARLVERQRVALVPGSPRFFGPGAQGHLRLSLATSRGVLDQGLDRLAAGLAALAAAPR